MGTNRLICRWFILIAGITLSTGHADTIYKYVDEQGNIIYSEQPPAAGDNVKAIEPIQDPSEEEVEAARERQEKLQQQLDQSSSQTRETQSTDWAAMREAHRRRAFWGKDWPVHEPPNR